MQERVLEAGSWQTPQADTAPELTRKSEVSVGEHLIQF